jgi:hypoxanthine phosphoribosyltransferase
MNYRIDEMISEERLAVRIRELGAAITEHYRDTSCLILVGLLRGSCVFLSDLCRQIKLPVNLDFMTASSYGTAMSSSRDVRILKDLDDDIQGKDVLIVEDIIDTGYTLEKVARYYPCASRKAWLYAPCWTSRAGARCRCRWNGWAFPYPTNSSWAAA